jgi:hypothetical protein
MTEAGSVTVSKEATRVARGGGGREVNVAFRCVNLLAVICSRLMK